MKFFSFFIFFTLFFLSSLSAQDRVGGSPLGPDVAQFNGKKLQWEEGSHDYFVLFASSLDDVDPGNNSGGMNPSADVCLESSTYTLKSTDIPDDAYVESAYLVWAGTKDLDDGTNPAKNNVDLDFNHKDGAFSGSYTVQTSQAKHTENPNQDFEFESIDICSMGDCTMGGRWYTYRAEVTEIFDDIHQKGRDEGLRDGISLLGDYTVRGIECSEDDFYAKNNNGSNSVMVSGWTLFIVYRSEAVNAKKIYVYRGFDLYQMDSIDLNISGFEFPNYPTVRLTVVAHEGDPGLATSMDGFSPAPPEGLQVSGATNENWAPLYNECNPLKHQDSQGNPFDYVEMYNSISSMYGWNEEVPTCNGDPMNPSSSKLQYGLDVDTIIMNAENSPFDEHFIKGDENMWLRIGANGDMIFTNILLLSVDTKAPKFDIPKNPNTPSGREKNFCSCALEEDSVCEDYPFWYSIKIQNWGNRLTKDITFKDQLSPHVDYISGTSEICRKFDENEMCLEWNEVEDASGGSFPFADEYHVADVMDKCDPELNVCPDTVMIRFKVSPKSSISKNTVIENMARINDEEDRVYKTNTSVPLRLTIAADSNCPSKEACENPDMAKCGGNPGDSCQEDEDCGENEKCDTNTGECVKDPDVFAENATLSYSSDYTAADDDHRIIISSPEENLVAGRFDVFASVDGDASGKKFVFEKTSVKFDFDDSGINFDRLALYYDTNKDGVLSSDDAKVAESGGLQSKYASFVLDSDSNMFDVNTSHRFFVVVDVSYDRDSIGTGVYFNAEIESPDAFTSYDANGDMAVSGEEIIFPTFEFEAYEDVFVFTEASPVSTLKATSSTVMLKLRAVSKGRENSLRNLNIRTFQDSVIFGSGIKSILLFLDTNADGVYDQQSKFLAGERDIDTVRNSMNIGLEEAFNMEADKEYRMLIVANLDISRDEHAQIIIDSINISDNSVSVQGIPLYSMKFTAEGSVSEGDGNGETSPSEDEGCACSFVSGESPGFNGAVFMLLFSFLASLFMVKRLKS